jgi:tyrosine-protein phosphatase YwqE
VYGAHDLAEAFAMARHAYQDGIRPIIATPHLNIHYNNTRAHVQNKMETLRPQEKSLANARLSHEILLAKIIESTCQIRCDHFC